MTDCTSMPQNKRIEIDVAEYDTIKYWKQRALGLEKLLEASIQREQILQDKLLERINNIERANNFLHFILQNAPVVIGHQDKELIPEKQMWEYSQDLGSKNLKSSREVLEKRLPAKREITFETELFGSKTFLIYVEPVFSKVRKREMMAKIREEIAVQKAKETELNKTIHITDEEILLFSHSLLIEETMRAKQMLATMSHEIRSSLSGVVSMAEVLSTTKLDGEQRQLLIISMVEVLF
ncbi:hypothetical protein Ahy_A03g015272 isoform A [Arachis hypogaea]|uniref:histidine kinase n=1 Tax=Arachis hypogaea TaxID=3818 RepID=A0A445E007_ARAHY|nr:hypothetical protein Ahy_A03g015272 isoform A [Arachis hypogaea]